jgi:hypothetical protein
MLQVEATGINQPNISALSDVRFETAMANSDGNIDQALLVIVSSTIILNILVRMGYAVA